MIGAFSATWLVIAVAQLIVSARDRRRGGPAR